MVQVATLSEALLMTGYYPQVYKDHLVLEPLRMLHESPTLSPRRATFVVANSFVTPPAYCP